jgi:carboxypeptidase family protein
MGEKSGATLGHAATSKLRNRAARPRQVNVNFTQIASDRKIRLQFRGAPRQSRILLVSLILAVSSLAVPAFAQSQQGTIDAAQAFGPEVSAQPVPGSVSGTVIDPSGAAVCNARVQLRHDDLPAAQESLSGSDGGFSFTNVSPGAFQLTIAADGFATQTVSGRLQSGADYSAARIALALAEEKTDVEVIVPRVEVAEQEIKEEEKQRVLGFLPNFYVSYVPDAAPLTTKQKFELAWRSTLDPVNLVITAAVAGAQQADNSFKEYGQGAQGYGKRYGADFTDSMTSIFIGSAILPSVLKQDPRYFYKGTGSVRSRIFYAFEMAVICKGDNGRLQPNYSSILGSLAAGGISNLYYPVNDRSGTALTLENTAIGIGTTAAANMLQEFVIRKLTPAGRNRDKKTDPALLSD